MRLSSKYTIKYYFALGTLVCSLLLTGCPTPPEFSVTPRIAFEDVYTYNDTIKLDDSQDIIEQVISLSIYFEDGNGDLGLRSDTDLPIYDQFIVPRKSNNEPIYLGDSDTLPPFNNTDYFTVDSADVNGETVGQVLVLPGDTLYVKPNPRSKNIFVKFFYQPVNDSEFIRYDYNGAFNGRFPLLNTENYERPLNGTLQYEIKSDGFRFDFRLQLIKLEVYIVDRENNKSNTITTVPFQLSL